MLNFQQMAILARRKRAKDAKAEGHGPKAPRKKQKPAKARSPGVRSREAEGLGARESEGLRARHKRDKRERLRRAAWDLFSTVGYDETTTRAIAERAGVAAGTVFLYAKDKQDLLFLVFEERLAECIDEAFRTLPRGLTLNRELLHVFRRVFSLYGESPDLGRRFVKELPGASGPNADRVNAMTFTFLINLGELVERAQAKGEVRKDVMPLLAAQAFFALYFMALMSWLSGFSSMEGALDGSLSSSLDLLMQGMSAAHAPGKSPEGDLPTYSARGRSK